MITLPATSSTRKLTMKTLITLAAILLLQACKHPLAIIGEGDIVDLNASGHGCTLEQFQAQDPACTENDVTGFYDVIYQAIPRPGWKFVRWEGPCGVDSRKPLCSHNVSDTRLTWWEENFSDADVPTTTVVFERVVTEFTESEIAALGALTMHREGRNNRDVAQMAAARNYPFVIMGNFVIIHATAEEFTELEEVAIAVFDAQGFDHSTWDSIQIIRSSADKVHIVARWSLFNGAGDRFLTAEVLYVVTNKGGHWGIQNTSDTDQQ
jgi:hypothetical protein